MNESFGSDLFNESFETVRKTALNTLFLNRTEHFVICKNRWLNWSGVRFPKASLPNYSRKSRWTLLVQTDYRLQPRSLLQYLSFIEPRTISVEHVRLAVIEPKEPSYVRYFSTGSLKRPVQKNRFTKIESDVPAVSSTTIECALARISTHWLFFFYDVRVQAALTTTCVCCECVCCKL